NFATADRKKANEDDEAEGELPPLAEGQELWLARIDLKACQTKPPKRYSQASLIRVLEKEGVGRPATYAAILDNILSRGYIAEEDKSLLCTALGLTLIDTLVRGFEGHFVEIGF